MTGYLRRFNNNKPLIFVFTIMMSLFLLGNSPLRIEGCKIPRRGVSSLERRQTSLSSDQEPQQKQIAEGQQISEEQQINQSSSETTNTEGKNNIIEKLLYLNLFFVLTLLIFAIVDFLWHRNLAKAISSLGGGQVSKSDINTLKSSITDLFKELELKIEKLQNDKRLNNDKSLNNDMVSPVKIQTTEIEKPPLEQFVELYNRSVKDHSIRSEFNNKYRPIRMGVTNFEARRIDLKVEACFENWESGDYLIVELELNGEPKYASVPRFDLPIQDVNYSIGAIGMVFKCPGYNPKLQYIDVLVVSPAFFKQEKSSNQWKLETQGELKLGQGKQK